MSAELKLECAFHQDETRGDTRLIRPLGHAAQKRSHECAGAHRRQGHEVVDVAEGDGDRRERQHHAAVVVRLHDIASWSSMHAAHLVWSSAIGTSHLSRDIWCHEKASM